MKSSNQQIHLDVFNDLKIVMKREDLLHPVVSGNKFRKLKYNLKEAKQQNHNTLLTFGGAFSNHIAAVAGAGNEYGYKTIGIIRGEELRNKVAENPTLRYAQSVGMLLAFVSREAYRKKDDVHFINTLKQNFGDFYLLPEGGTNALAIKGCEEILTEEDVEFDYICCPVGTAGTIVGLINSAKSHQTILGFPALKGDFLKTNIERLSQNKKNWLLVGDYHFGGYGKINEELVTFINKFKRETKIPLDPIYTGKMLFGMVNLATKGYFKKGSKVLVIHTGGLQGVEGMNYKLKKQNSTLLE